MIYAYMRVSTPQQTLENQHYALLKFADQQAWRIDAWITETGKRSQALHRTYPRPAPEPVDGP